MIDKIDPLWSVDQSDPMAAIGPLPVIVTYQAL